MLVKVLLNGGGYLSQTCFHAVYERVGGEERLSGEDAGPDERAEEAGQQIGSRQIPDSVSFLPARDSVAENDSAKVAQRWVKSKHEAGRSFILSKTLHLLVRERLDPAADDL